MNRLTTIVMIIFLAISLPQDASGEVENSAKNNVTQTKGSSSQKVNKATKGYQSNKMQDKTLDTQELSSSLNNKEDVSLWGLFLQAGFIVKMVITLLFMASIYVWAIFINKTIAIKALKKRISSFERLFWSGKSLDSIKELATLPEYASPHADLCNAVFREFSNESKDSKFLVERFNNVREVAISSFSSMIKKDVNYLATIASSSLFIGLFGTVCGIMSNFQAIAASKNTTLAVIAPGIAEALFATAIGLIAAIPAVIFYNELTEKIRKLEDSAYNFSNDVMNIVLAGLDNSNN